MEGRVYGCRRKTIKKMQAKIQDAHEAIRPTNIALTPVKGERIAQQRSVPPLSADLEAIYCQPDAECPL